ncbi:MAG: GSU2403 family nucleotidyltransferase fold protein [Thermoanaerobaculia bacterium]
MTFIRLPLAVQTLYAELLDQLRTVDARAAAGDLAGSLVSKQIRGRAYWYLQRSEGAAKRQIYIGPDGSEEVERVRLALEDRPVRAIDGARRRDLVTMLAAGGMFRESAAIATVLRILADASVFRAGGVLVGTQAFNCLANMLGVSFDHAASRTADVDGAHDAAIPVAIEERRSEAELIAALRTADPGFFAVPGIDSRDPSTSFHVRGRDLRVDFLTPDRSRGKNSKPVMLAHLGCAAQPLAGLDYLIEESVDAAVVGGNGIRVHVPLPARFAVHKLWVAAGRPASEAAKSRKDILQATALLEALAEDRPGDVARAFKIAARRPSMWRRVKAQLGRLDANVTAMLRPLLP